MSKKQELSEILERIYRIITAAKENFEYANYLYEPLTSIEREYVQIDNNLQFIRFSLWQMAVIELDKLLSKPSNHQFNLFKLIRKLKPGGYFSLVKIPELHIGIWESRLLSQGKTIGKISLFRDKYFAHTDPIKKEVDAPSLSLIEIRELFHCIVNVFNNIAQAALQVDYIFLPYYFVREDFDMVKILAQFHQNELEKIQG